MISNIDHIAIAVHNLQDALERFRVLTGVADEQIRIEDFSKNGEKDSIISHLKPKTSRLKSQEPPMRTSVHSSPLLKVRARKK